MKKNIFTAKTHGCRSPLDSKGETMTKMKISRIAIVAFLLCLGISVVNSFAQAPIPEPGAPRPVLIPAVKEAKLKNGLTVAVVEKKGVPIVTVQLLVRAGAASEGIEKAGLANMTASMLTKGTKTRTAEQIAEEIEFLGGSIGSGAGWNSSTVTISVTSDKLDQALAIMADVVLNPSFAEKELDLLKSQDLDELKYSLTQPGFLATYAASRYSFGEHPPSGTPTSVAGMTRNDVAAFHSANYRSDLAVLIFTGDISLEKATASAEKLFSAMPKWEGTPGVRAESVGTISGPPSEAFKRMVVIDLPNSGQASVNYFKTIDGVGRKANDYYPASVLNSLLGGGYSSRLNQEIRIKRGLSYGAGSSFTWRSSRNNFSTRTQTKNESAPEVAELVLVELKRLSADPIAASELTPRKSVLTGNFGRNLETTGGLAGAVADLYGFGIPTSELNAYSDKVGRVTDDEIRSFALRTLLGGDVIIVGDYAKFKDDLAKRFPNITIEVVKADELDITKANLKK